MTRIDLYDTPEECSFALTECRPMCDFTLRSSVFANPNLDHHRTRVKGYTEITESKWNSSAALGSLLDEHTTSGRLAQYLVYNL